MILFLAWLLLCGTQHNGRLFVEETQSDVHTSFYSKTFERNNRKTVNKSRFQAKQLENQNSIITETTKIKMVAPEALHQKIRSKEEKKKKKPFSTLLF